MSVRFSANLKNLFKSEVKQDLPDNGFELQGTNGEAIILIHGMTGTPHEMRFLANYLNRQGYTIYCPRLANHGAPIHILQMSKWQDFYQTVRQSYLKVRGKHKHIYAGGLSMGALLALLLADEFKNEIAGVSCLSPTLFYDGWNTPWYSFFLPLAYKTPLKYFFSPKLIVSFTESLVITTLAPSIPNFEMDIQKKEDPKGDRVVITMNGKFLPYKKW